VVVLVEEEEWALVVVSPGVLLAMIVQSAAK
jgi:hypothetical protein